MGDFRWEQLGETAVRAYAYAAGRADVDRAELGEALGAHDETESEPGEREPGEREPGTPSAAKHEPGEREPGTPSAAKHEPGKREPGTPSAAKHEPGKREPGTPSAAKHEPGKREPGKREAEKREAGKAGATDRDENGRAGRGVGGAPRQAEVEAAVDRLLEAGLLRPAEDDRRLTAVSPEIARTLLLGPVEEAIAELREQAGRARLAFDDLMPAYRAGLPGRAPEHAIELVLGADEVRRTIAGLAARCAEEALVGEPGDPWPGLGPDELPPRGVRLRMLCRHADRYRPGAAARAGELAGLGAEIRSSAPGAARLLIFDRVVAVAPVRSGPDGVVLLREPNLIGCLAEQFEQFWMAALPFPERGVPALSVSDDIRAQIIRLLVDGEEDKVIARRIGLSLRTCQRHVAEIMAQLGARNRLHAGYLLARRAL